MSQTEQEQTGNLSSIASTSANNTAAQPQPVVNSDDPAWAHCFCADITKNHVLQCKYCNKLCKAGITGVKYHLARIKGFNVSKCTKVPTPVQQEMFDLLTKKGAEKEQRIIEKEASRGAVNLDQSGDENGSDEDSCHRNDILVVKQKQGSTTSTSAACGSTIDKFYKAPSIKESVTQRGIKLSNKIQTTLTTQKREERRDRACEYICQWFYEASVPHNTVTLSSFDHMLEAIAQFGRGLKGPSVYEMSGPFLQKSKQKVLDGFKDHTESWELTGCTVMTDAWTDKRGRGVFHEFF